MEWYQFSRLLSRPEAARREKRSQEAISDEFEEKNVENSFRTQFRAQFWRALSLKLDSWLILWKQFLDWIGLRRQELEVMQILEFLENKSLAKVDVPLWKMVLLKVLTEVVPLEGGGS